MEIEKAYFTLPEVLALWSMPEVDLVYLAENDQLRLSVRILNLPIEFGDFAVPIGSQASESAVPRPLPDPLCGIRRGMEGDGDPTGTRFTP